MHFAAGNRQQAMARIATGNYDAVIVSHSSFEKLPVSDETVQALRRTNRLSSSKTAIYEAKAEKGDNRRIVKELEKAKKRLVDQAQGARRPRAQGRRASPSRRLGVDQIFVDEADLYKNLFYTTKMNRIAGLPNSESNRALDMYMKTRYLARARRRRGLRHRHADLEHHGRDVHDAALSRAGTAARPRASSISTPGPRISAKPVTALELAPDGSGYRMHTRFAKFVNLPELLSMFRTFADVQTADMLNLPRPDIEGGKPQITAAPASPELKAFIETLVERAAETAHGDGSIRASTTC